MGNTVDFDEILVDAEMDDEEFDEEEFEVEALVAQPAPAKMMVTTSPFPTRTALELVQSPEKLFDFSKTKLNVQQQMYILQYAVRGTKLGACQGAGVPYSVVEKWNEDEEFVAALTEALEMTKDALEDELLRRAMNGSDKLMIEAIRAVKPEKYGRKETRDVNVRGTVVHTWSELAMQAKQLDDSSKAKAVEVECTEVEDDEESA